MQDNFQLKPIVIDRIVREAERKEITGLSRVRAWELEKIGLFPKRRKLSPQGQCVGWLLSELMEWVQSRPTV